MTTSMKTTRRQALLSLLFGSGYVGLRSLATGLPAAFLLNPRRAQAETCAGDAARAQYLIFSTSSAGDPLNCNAPGTYADPNIVHPANPMMAATATMLGTQSYTAAKVWSDASALLRDNLCFIHHNTGRNAHPDETAVLRLNGQIARVEMLPSFIARNTAPCLSTVQREPVVLGASNGLEQPIFEGRTLPTLTPLALRDTLLSPTGPLASANMIAMRDRHLDQMRLLMRDYGNTAQKGFIDTLANSQQAVRRISQNLLAMLSQINGTDKVRDQITAATVLIAMNVAPVVTIHLPFGGDNHTDTALAMEVSEHLTAVPNMSYMAQQLDTLTFGDGSKLSSRVTFAMVNVFGRTLKLKGTAGREHWGAHHVTVLHGKRIKPGVIGGLRPTTSGDDYTAIDFDATTGQARDGADVPLNQSLTAVGKTIAAAVGVSDTAINTDITGGKVITAALNP